MDPAELLEEEMLSKQKPMNAVIDEFSSPVQQFYCGATVLVTGGTGFLGKQLIEKLFRANKIKKVYLLIRSKKGKTIKERIDDILKDPAYDKVREKQPNFDEKVIPVEGDVAEIRLGLSDNDWNTIAAEVNMIFHLAATVRFDEPLRMATLINVQGTREIINLAKECKNLRSFVHISTAFSHATYSRVDKPILEKFYPSPMNPEAMIQLTETVDSQKLDAITSELIKDWPNTYTFTKAIAEEVVRTMAADLPACVVRPPIVACSYVEPMPGWLDLNAVASPSGVLIGVLSGLLHVFYVNNRNKLSIIPVDYVNNAIIAAGWDASQTVKSDKNNDIPVYNLANTQTYFQFGSIRKTLTQNYQLSSPKSVWFCYMIQTNIKVLYKILLWLLHYIPAYILDAVCFVLNKKPKNIKSFVKVFTKVDKFSTIFEYFITHEWLFNDDNLKSLFNRLSNDDKNIFNFDISTIDTAEFSIVWMLGIRKYILKDGLKGSNIAYRKQTILKYASYVLLLGYGYGIYKILYVVWFVVTYIFSAIFCMFHVN